MADCIFCKIANEGLPAHGLYEDERFIVILDKGSLGIGHCMIIPKRHVIQIFELGEEDYTDLFLLAKKLAPHLQKATTSKAVGYVAFGSGLPHAHLHLVPHNKSEELEHPQPRNLSELDLEANAAYIRPFLVEKL